MLYDRIVEAKLRQVYAALNRGDAAPMLASLAPRFTYRFEGDTSIGGQRHTQAAMRLWWARLFRLLPGLRFTIDQVIVKGPPWATRIAVELTVTTGPAETGGYTNPVMQFADMRWGRLTRIHTLEDTLLVHRNFTRLAAEGIAEATAPPILG
jgi:ketosteroid isomerase-like protein